MEFHMLFQFYVGISQPTMVKYALTGLLGFKEMLIISFFSFVGVK